MYKFDESNSSFRKDYIIDVLIQEKQWILINGKRLSNMDDEQKRNWISITNDLMT